MPHLAAGNKGMCVYGLLFIIARLDAKEGEEEEGEEAGFSVFLLTEDGGRV